jgi:hypothetical protein
MDRKKNNYYSINLDNLKEIMQQEKNKDSESYCGLMDHPMKVNFTRIIYKESANIYGLMVDHIKVSGRIIKSKNR